MVVEEDPGVRVDLRCPAGLTFRSGQTIQSHVCIAQQKLWWLPPSNCGVLIFKN